MVDFVCFWVFVICKLIGNVILVIFSMLVLMFKFNCICVVCVCVCYCFVFGFDKNCFGGLIVMVGGLMIFSDSEIVLSFRMLSIIGVIFMVDWLFVICVVVVRRLSILMVVLRVVCLLFVSVSICNKFGDEVLLLLILIGIFRLLLNDSVLLVFVLFIDILVRLDCDVIEIIVLKKVFRLGESDSSFCIDFVFSVIVRLVRWMLVVVSF